MLVCTGVHEYRFIHLHLHTTSHNHTSTPPHKHHTNTHTHSHIHIHTHNTQHYTHTLARSVVKPPTLKRESPLQRPQVIGLGLKVRVTAEVKKVLGDD